MLVPAKNVSPGPQILMFGGETRTVEPGQTTLLPMHLAMQWMTSPSRRGDWRMDFHGLPLKTFDERAISFASAINRTTGYGKQGYYIMKGMVNSGLDVHYQQVSGYAAPYFPDIDDHLSSIINREDREVTEWGLVHSVVEALENMPTPKNIMWSMWEADMLPDHRPSGPYSHWAEKINRFSKAVIVPATEQKAIFERSGVDKPIYVVHDAVDPAKWAFKERSFPRHRPFTFFVWAYMNSRKAPWETVNSFLSAFGPNNPNVRLVCKTMSNQFGAGKFGIPKNLGVNNVRIINERWTEEQVLDFLYKEVDACFFLSKGEGFYDPPLEALSTGLPVIVPDHSGPHDYADPAYVYPIRTKKMEPAPQGDYMQWWIPDYDQAIHHLREVYSHYDAALEKAKKGSQWVADRWSVEHQRQDLMGVLEQICHD